MIYVDKLMDRKWKYGPNCHLLADTVDELHEFAAKIGMKRSWLQYSNRGIPHYDLTATRRKLAVENGATEIGIRKVGELMQKFRQNI